jgi:hypothetical protein
MREHLQQNDGCTTTGNCMPSHAGLAVAFTRAANTTGSFSAVISLAAHSSWAVWHIAKNSECDSAQPQMHINPPQMHIDMTPPVADTPLLENSTSYSSSSCWLNQ